MLMRRQLKFLMICTRVGVGVVAGVRVGVGVVVGVWVVGLMILAHCLEYNKMSYNDQDSHHLLIWLNRERLQISEKHRIFSFEQVAHSRIVPYLLGKINPTFFSDLIELAFQYRPCLLKIEKYLNHVEELRFKRVNKQHLLENQYISELIKLILFLIMRQEMKQEFVNRILELEEETQIYLMYEIKRVESWLENKMEIKEVYQTIEELEEDNEALSHRLKELQAKKSQTIALKGQLQLENKKLLSQHRQNLSQKTEVIEQLGLSHPKDYLEIYRDLILQRSQLVSSHTQNQQAIDRVSQQNKQMHQKIAQDSLIIQHLTQEIERYKQIFSKLNLKKSSATNYDYSRQEKQNACRQFSTVFPSVKMINSAIMERQSTSLLGRSVTDFSIEDENINGVVMSYQEDLASKLQEMYVKIGILNEEVTQLKEVNMKLVGKNQRKQKLANTVLRQKQQFFLNYELTISG